MLVMRTLLGFLVITVAATLGFAQDKKVDIDITTKSEDKSIFMQPWVWVVGGAVFLLLLVALLRPSKK